jgi:hypothetical protein
MRSEILGRHLATLARQRRPILEAVEPLSPAVLWARPRPESWSIGETLQHLARMMRLFRRFAAAALPLERPLARVLRRRPYATCSRDLFSGRSRSAPRPLRPQAPTEPTPPVVVVGELERETASLARLLVDEDEGVLGHVWLWDPVMGRQNMLQIVDLLGIHEAHHFRILRSRWPGYFGVVQAGDGD